MKNFWKKGISGFLVIVMVMSIVGIFPQKAYAATPYAWTDIFNLMGISPAYGVAVDSAGNAYAYDNARSQLKILSGSTMTSYQVNPNGPARIWGEAHGIAVDNAGTVYVAEYAPPQSTNNTCHVLKNMANDRYDWTDITAGGGFGTSTSINGVTTDNSGNVYVVDFANSRIMKYNGSSWTAISNGEFQMPWGIAVDNGGNVYVTDMQTGKLMKRVGTTWTDITNGGNLSGPMDVKVDNSGNIYVVDNNNNRIREYTGGAWTTVYSKNGLYSFAINSSAGSSGMMYATVYMGPGPIIGAFCRYGPGTSANSGNNTVSASVSSVQANSPVTLTAVGDRQSENGVFVNDERYIPISWTSTETGKSGTFTLNGGSYTDTYTPLTAGTYTITATYKKQTWNQVLNGQGSGYITSWNDSGTTVTATTTLTVTPPAAIPASAVNNSVSVNPNSILAGNAVTITAVGDRESASGVVSGDERYIPTTWTSTETGKSGTFTLNGGSYTSSYTPSAGGNKSITATFKKQTFNGSTWSDSGTTDTKTTTLTVTVPVANADPNNNSLTSNQSSITIGESVILTATGDRQSAAGVMVGDTRYIPTVWSSTDGSNGSFTLTNGAYTSSYTPSASGLKFVTATFKQQRWDGTTWSDYGSSQQRSANFTVNALQPTLADPTKDTVSLSANTIAIGGSVTITATGDRQSAVGNILGDQRIIPVSWSSSNGQNGTFAFSGGNYTSNYSPSGYGGTYSINVNFKLQNWDTSSWVSAGPGYYQSSIDLTIVSPVTVIYVDFYNNPNLPIDNTQYMPGDTVTVSTNAMTRVGFAFAGWNPDPFGGGTTYTPGDTFIMGSSNVTLYSMWTIPPAAASAGNNQVDLSSSIGAVGYPVKITATGDRQSAAGSLNGDERYIPTTWTSTETGKSGTFTLNSGEYTSDYTPSAAGTYTVTANFKKQSWNGTAWVDSGTTDTKTTTITVDSKITFTSDRYVLAYRQYATITSNAPDGTLVAYSSDGTTYYADDIASIRQLPWRWYGRNSSTNVTLTIRLYNDTYNNQNEIDPAQSFVKEIQIVFLPDPYLSANTDAANNAISAHPSSMALGSTTTLIAYGDRELFEGSSTGDKRYIPVAWVSSEGTSGIFTPADPSNGIIDYTANYTPTAAGTYTITATFQKQTYNASNWTWYDAAGETDTKTTTITVGAAASTYTVTYNLNGGSGTVPTDSNTYTAGATVTLASGSGLSKSGCTFGGWSLTSTGSAISGSTYTMPANNATLYAVWNSSSAQTYTVTYNANGGSGAVPTDSCTYASGDTVTLKSGSGLNKSGCTFGGWSLTQGGTAISGSTYTMPANNVTLYAVWNSSSAQTFTVTYNANGGSGTVPTDSGTYATGATVILASGSGLTKTGYTFGGWNTRANGWGTNYNTTSDTFSMGTSNVILYAKWNPNQCTVTYDYNYGTAGTYATQSVNEGTMTTAPAKPIRAGYDFMGWYQEVGCTNAWNFKTDTVTVNKTLYANWQQQQQQTFTVTYAANGANSGSVPVDYKTYSSGSAVRVIGNIGSIAKAGNTFEGWSDGVTTYTAGQTFTIAGDVTLSAVWTAVSTTYTVTYSNNYTSGGTYTTQNNISSGATLTAPALPSRTGYTFVAWYKDAACVNLLDFSRYTVTSDTTLYAKWTEDTYSIDGTVKDDANPANPVIGATVRVIQGNIQFGSTETTDSNGNFSLTGVPNGTYNLVITKEGQEVTVCVIINGSNYNYNGVITFPTGNKNSKLDVVGADTPNVVVDQLNNVFSDANVYTSTDANTVSSGGTVEIKLAVQKNDESTNKTLVEAAMTSGGYSTGTILDVDMTKTSVSSSGITDISAITAINNLITIIIPLPAELQGKNSYVVYRAHDYGSGVVADAITTTANSNGEYIAVSSDKTQLTAYLKYFSTYAIGYTTASSGGNSGGSSVGSSGGGGGGLTAPANTGVDVLVNGKAEYAGTATDGTRASQTMTTIVVDEQKLKQRMESEGNNAIVTVPANTKADILVGVLNGQMIKDMETKQDTLEIRTDTASYFIPAQQINIDAISAQVGQSVDLKDINVQVEIAKSTTDTVKVVEDSAQRGSFTIMLPPMDFTVKGTYGGKTVDVSKFNVYVKRLIAIPDGVDPNKITTGVITEPDGTSRHVPTEVTQINGKYYATINSLTNSTYSVVWHPLEFSDVVNHWAKTDVNDMGSRMVVSGIGNGLYEPDRDITRAEFAAIIVRALGLKPGEGSNQFTDVESNKWYCDYIKTATSYNIIKGYGNSKFGPMDKITREQAMAMIARAMNITGLNAGLESGETEKLLSSFNDGVITSDYAKTSIAECVKTGVVSGRGNNIVAPKDNITRAEVAAIVKRLLKKSNLI